MKTAMFINKSRFILVIAAMLSLVFLAAIPKVSAAIDCSAVPASEKTKCEACKGSGGQSYSSGVCGDGTSVNAEDTVSTLVEDVITIFSWIVGVASVLMIMVGGFKYITSQGDSNSINSAKNTILYAIIGLVIVAFAQVIVRFVINKI